MECLRTFSFFSNDSGNFTSPDLNVWGLAPQNYWNVRVAAVSTFNIQGFKNINIYKIQSVGNISTLLGTGNSAIVQDWEIEIRINGVQSTIGNTIGSPNQFSISTTNVNPSFRISKYSPCIEFIEPISSVQSIQIIGLNAFGIGAQNITTPAVNLNTNLTFICYYTFEGEDLLF